MEVGVDPGWDVAADESGGRVLHLSDMVYEKRRDFIIRLTTLAAKDIIHSSCSSNGTRYRRF